MCECGGGVDEAVMERYLEAPLSVSRQWEGLLFQGVKGLEGGVCVCVTSHLLLNPISKARGLNQPSPLKACQGRAHK